LEKATKHPDETILLVEDEPAIRLLIRRVLENQGYQMLEACNGQEALGLAADYSGPIDLLLTDVVMPRMDGFTLGEQLVASHPETRVLFLSGQADQSVAVRGGLKEAGEAFLLKPFTHAILLQSIRDRLDTEPGPSRPES
jgi:CheY-like chemotaxis protein